MRQKYPFGKKKLKKSEETALQAQKIETGKTDDFLQKYRLQEFRSFDLESLNRSTPKKE